MIPVPGYIYIYMYTYTVNTNIRTGYMFLLLLLYPENRLYHFFKAAMIDFYCTGFICTDIRYIQ